MSDLRRHRLALECALLALVAYLGAFGVSALLRSGPDDVSRADAEDGTAAAAPAVEPLAAYAVIAERDVFNPTPGGAAEDERRTLRLEGVALRGPEARAVIEDTTTRRQELYRVGDAVGDARVTAIDWDRVTLTRGGREEVLALGPPDTRPEEAGAGAEGTTAVASAPAPTDARIRRTGENAFVVDRRELAGVSGNMSALVTQLRAVAEVREGRPAGFRLFQIRDGSLFARLGLHDGDVVRRVNGSPVADPTALLGFLQHLEREPRVALDIIRGDAPRTLVYDLR